eukprot:CAMPEP_0194289848 /NCGR_PEP_ID=MMETSP0169-20130528/39987_1 /TAXON_ID=218684 /ORGANISM="Corethron pennatum, Strain L29A3" /LENGTH=121 /DNA_ID=CAMNT_0039037265 /DNA_START=69 /DNA_END=434 /DNA_ORIENTATION=+
MTIIRCRGALVAAACTIFGSSLDAFTSSHRFVHGRIQREKNFPTAKGLLSTSLDEDCGCGPNIAQLTSGKLSDEAKSMDHRQVISGTSIYDLSGDVRDTDDIIGGSSDNSVSIVVFLRSFG